MLLFYGEIPSLSNYKKICLFFKSFHGLALITGVICMTLAIIYKCLLVNIPAKYEWMIGCGEVFYNIELSIIASCIFYFITIYFPEKKQSNKLAPQIIFLLNQFVHIGNEILTDIGDDKEISKDDFNTKANKIKMNEIPGKTSLYKINTKFNTILKNAYPVPQNWYQFFRLYFEEEDNVIYRLQPFWGYLPEEVIIDLQKIQNNDNLRQAINYYEYNYTNNIIIGDTNFTNLGGVSNLIWLHIKCLQEIVTKYQEGII